MKPRGQKVALVVKKYQRDRVYEFGNLYERKKTHPATYTTKRGKIQELTYKSRKRCKLAIRNTIHLMTTEAGVTYPKEYPIDGRTVKKHLNTLLQWLRRRNAEYVWVIEFQERGAPHYHFILSRPFDEGEWSRAWNRIISADLPKYRDDPSALKHGAHIALIRHSGKYGNYMTTYLNKLDQKEVPEYYQSVGRFWGMTRGLLKVVVDSVHGDYRDLSRLTRVDRRRKSASVRQHFGQKWQWGGKGFTLYDSESKVNICSS